MEGDSGGLEELWIGFLAHRMASGWPDGGLVGVWLGLAGAGWEAGWPQGPPGAEAMRSVRVIC